MNHITVTNISDYAFVNFDTLTQPVKGVLIDCHGFTDESTFQSSPRMGADLGKEGVVYIFPYYSPWAWCGDNCLAYIEQVLDAVWEKLDLSPDIPFMVTGGSMGGMTAMLYSIYGKRPVLGVACNCPVCDLRVIMSQSDYVRRSVFNAYLCTGREMEEEFSRHNPIEQVEKMPDVPFLIVSGSIDTAVPAPTHAQPLQRVMEQAGKNATFLHVEGMSHCNIGDFEEAYQTYLAFCLKTLGVREEA